jgi:hypothetical protein
MSITYFPPSTAANALLRFPNGSWYQADGNQPVSQINKAIPVYMTNVIASNAITLGDMVATFNVTSSSTTLTVSSHAGDPIQLGSTIIGAGFEGASFTGSISGSLLTVTAVASGTIATGMYITNTSITAGTQIVLGGTGTGGVGTYNLSNIISQTVPSGAMTGYGHTITAYGTGTGGNGTYTLSAAHTISSPVAASSRTKSKLTFLIPGYYNIQFSVQVVSSSGSTQHIWLWPRVNGVDVPDSNTKWSVQGTSAAVVPALNFVLAIAAGDYVQLMMAGDNNNLYLLREAATAFGPSIPSVILTATFVSGLY